MGNFLKGAKAFTGTLLFGSDESQGLIKTLGSASLEAGKNFSSTMLEQLTHIKDEQGRIDRVTAVGGDPNIPDGEGIGLEGSGYYENGILIIPDDETEAEYY